MSLKTLGPKSAWKAVQCSQVRASLHVGIRFGLAWQGMHLMNLIGFHQNDRAQGTPTRVVLRSRGGNV